MVTTGGENFEHLASVDRRAFRSPNSTFLVGFFGYKMKDC